MLTLQNVTKTFNPGTVNEKTALSGVELHLEQISSPSWAPTGRGNPPSSGPSPGPSPLIPAESSWTARM